MSFVLGVLVSIGWVGTVHAQSLGGNSGPYVGVSVGTFSYEQGNDGPFGTAYSDRAGVYRLFAGYQLNRVYSIEVGMAESKDFSETFVAMSPGVGAFLVDSTANYKISTLRVLAFAPFSSLRMFGGIGVYNAKLEAELSSPMVALDVDPFKETGSGVTIAGGVQYDMRHISIRGEYEWFNTKDLPKASSINIGVLFVF